MAENSSARSGGIGFAGLLTIIFIVMKLAHIGDVANWSWFMVFIPIWGTIALVIGGLIIYVLFKVIQGVVRFYQERKEMKQIAKAIDAGEDVPSHKRIKFMLWMRKHKAKVDEKKIMGDTPDPTKSKWQLRMEEMQKQQEELRKRSGY
jgi:hypothetical protein